MNRAYSENLENLTHVTEFYRVDVTRKLDRKIRSSMGQFLTPASVANFMASLFRRKGDVVLLEPGAGVGNLTAAFLEKYLIVKEPPSTIQVDVYELAPIMLEYLESTLKRCEHACKKQNIHFSGRAIAGDFIKEAVEFLLNQNSLFGKASHGYTHCIMNPPYKKIRSDSDYRGWLRHVGIETSNLYSAFLALAIKLLRMGGELVAIVPRSFCNGVYFKPFRKLLLEEMSLIQLHVFDTRDQAFKDDEVLQENIIFHAVKGTPQKEVVISSSNDQIFEDMTLRKVSFDKVVKPCDPDQFIHIAVSDFDQMIVDRMSVFSNSLNELKLDVSTGPVVDFRLKDDIRQTNEQGAYPLIYPGHFAGSFISWPNHKNKKPNSIFESNKSSKWLMPNGWYVLTRRFSAKEERRRIVAAIHNPSNVRGDKVGFENHVNVFHRNKAGLDPHVAKGLTVFLNSTLVDLYFRQFSGHTQVNATDLRLLHYPSLDTLINLGKNVGDTFPQQNDIDKLIEDEINTMAKQKQNGTDPIQIQQKIQDALSILESLGMPKGQQNERSALTLLALLALKPKNKWKKADKPLMGITPIMDFIRNYYGKTYAPNTRETIRRQTMHQFVDAGIAVPNPDKPDRPINSPKWVYQTSPDCLNLIRTFDTANWNKNLATYLTKRKTLTQQYAKARQMQMIPLKINDAHELYLTPGAHSELIKAVIVQFGPRFAPGAEVLYVGETGTKMSHFDESTFRQLGLNFDSHGKFPDVVLYQRDKNWLILVEAVTSHGPVDAKRHAELSALFSVSKEKIIYVTAFPDRQTLAKYLSDISWETEVWVADAPTHLIHFDGERFLGPYEE